MGPIFCSYAEEQESISNLRSQLLEQDKYLNDCCIFKYSMIRTSSREEQKKTETRAKKNKTSLNLYTLISIVINSTIKISSAEFHSELHKFNLIFNQPPSPRI